MSDRRGLLNRDANETCSLEHEGTNCTVTISRFDGGQAALTFIANHKRGNAADFAARDAGILLSFCLGYRCPIVAIALAVSRNSSASGVVAAVLNKITPGRS